MRYTWVLQGYGILHTALTLAQAEISNICHEFSQGFKRQVASPQAGLSLSLSKVRFIPNFLPEARQQGF